jgi:hypothetical protein
MILIIRRYQMSGDRFQRQPHPQPTSPAEKGAIILKEGNMF